VQTTPVMAVFQFEKESTPHSDVWEAKAIGTFTEPLHFEGSTRNGPNDPTHVRTRR